MRRPLAVAIVLILVLVAVPLALAGTGGGGHAYGKSKFQLNGTIVPGDAEDGSLVVLVKSGTRTVKAFRGLELPLVVDPEARIKDGPASEEAGEAVLLTPADLVAGARIHVGGRIDRTDPANPVFVARRIIVQRWPEVVPPEPMPEPSTEPTDAPTPDPTDSAAP